MSVVGWLLIGSIPGVLIGSQYSVRLPESTLRLTLACVLALSGLKLVNVPTTYLAVGLGLVVGMLVRAQRQWQAQRLAAGALTSPD